MECGAEGSRDLEGMNGESENAMMKWNENAGLQAKYCKSVSGVSFLVFALLYSGGGENRKQKNSRLSVAFDCSLSGRVCGADSALGSEKYMKFLQKQ